MARRHRCWRIVITYRRLLSTARSRPPQWTAFNCAPHRADLSSGSPSPSRNHTEHIPIEIDLGEHPDSAQPGEIQSDRYGSRRPARDRGDCFPFRRPRIEIPDGATHRERKEQRDYRRCLPRIIETALRTNKFSFSRSRTRGGGLVARRSANDPAYDGMRWLVYTLPLRF